MTTERGLLEEAGNKLVVQHEGQFILLKGAISFELPRGDLPVFVTIRFRRFIRYFIGHFSVKEKSTQSTLER